MPSGGGTVTRNADVLPFPFPARPQVMTGYIRFVELGTILISEARLWQISVADANPRLMVEAVSGVYRMRHSTDNGTVTSTLAVAPSIGDGVEVMAQVNVDGSIQIHQSINGAALTSGSVSSALALAPQWSGVILNINRGGARGFIAIREIVFHRGVQSLTTMRRLAGVT